MKATDLDASDLDVYAAYGASYSNYVWSNEEVEAVLKWVGELGNGIILTGCLQDPKNPEEVLNKEYKTPNQ